MLELGEILQISLHFQFTKMAAGATNTRLGAAMSLLFLCCCLASLLRPCAGAMFDVKARTLKCLSDELSKDVLATGDFLVSPSDASDVLSAGGESNVNVVVKDPEGRVMYRKEKVRSGKFALTTTMEGSHEICFNNKGEFTAAGEVQWRERAGRRLGGSFPRVQ